MAESCGRVPGAGQPRLRFAAAGAVTGVGPLPFSDPDEAVAFVAEYAPEIPFRPPLTALGDAAFAGLDGLVRPSSRAGSYEADPAGLAELEARLRFGLAEPAGEGLAGYAAFERAVAAGAFPRARAVKTEVTGPLTLAWSLKVDGMPVLHRPDVLAALAARVARLAAWEGERLAAFGLPVLVFVNEPALGWESDPAGAPSRGPVRGLSVVVDSLRAAGWLVAVHCGGAGSLEGLGRTGADIVSFDAHASALSGQVAGEALWGGPDDHRLVAFGLVPRDPSACSAEHLFAGWLGAAVTALDLSTASRRALMTAGRGAGWPDPASAEAAFGRAGEVAELVRSLAGSRSVVP